MRKGPPPRCGPFPRFAKLQHPPGWVFVQHPAWQSIFGVRKFVCEVANSAGPNNLLAALTGAGGDCPAKTTSRYFAPNFFRMRRDRLRSTLNGSAR
jgi:hypothetical protein